jgi:hypothetical protein
MKEPNLNIFFKILISSVLGMVLLFEPERRTEVIAWYKDILDFLYENIDDTNYYDANFASMLINQPMDFCAIELLPQIKRLYNTGLVDEMYCGDYDTVEKEITAGIIKPGDYCNLQSIYEVYK